MKQKDLIFISIISLISVILWTGFSIYHNTVTSTIPEVLNIQISGIVPDFDTKTIDQLKTRNKVVPSYDLLGGDASISSVSATPTPTTIPVTPSPVSTNSGSLAPQGGSIRQ